MPAAGAPKSAWRAWARERRSQSNPRELGSKITEQLREWPAYQAARGVLIYLAFGDEPELSDLLFDSGVSANRKAFYTTRTVDTGEPELTLHRLDGRSLEGTLERHRFGFLQPQASSAPASADQIDVVLVPGLAFDLAGNRLGFGLGFYDRLLGRMHRSVQRVGITSAELLVPRLPSDAHDVPMTHLATEDGVFPVAEDASSRP